MINIWITALQYFQELQVENLPLVNLNNRGYPYKVINITLSSKSISFLELSEVFKPLYRKL